MSSTGLVVRKNGVSGAILLLAGFNGAHQIRAGFDWRSRRQDAWLQARWSGRLQSSGHGGQCVRRCGGSTKTPHKSLRRRRISAASALAWRNPQGFGMPFLQPAANGASQEAFTICGRLVNSRVAGIRGTTAPDGALSGRMLTEGGKQADNGVGCGISPSLPRCGLEDENPWVFVIQTTPCHTMLHRSNFSI